jgi:hypothetical protein
VDVRMMVALGCLGGGSLWRDTWCWAAVLDLVAAAARHSDEANA